MKKDSSNLDLLRSVAVLAVFVAHLLYTFGIQTVLSVNVKPLGTAGVLIFFVHTSLVLMMSIERLNVGGWRRFASFYMRRIFRIYPLSICCVIAVFWLEIPRMPWDPGFDPISRRALLENVLLIQNFTLTAPVIGSLWSLPFELEMYVVLPFLFLFARRTAFPRAMIGVWILSTAVAAATLNSPARTRLDFLQFVPCFLAGVIAYQLWGKVPANRSFWLWPVVIAVILLIYVGFDARTRGWGECLMLGLAVPHFRESRLVWLKKVSQAVARYSYGIYLLHAPLMWVAFVKLRFQPLWIRWTFFAVLMLTLCVAAYHLVEAPLLRLGGTLSKRFHTQTDDESLVRGRLVSAASGPIGRP